MELLLYLGMSGVGCMETVRRLLLVIRATIYRLMMLKKVLALNHSVLKSYSVYSSRFGALKMQEKGTQKRWKIKDANRWPNDI